MTEDKKYKSLKIIAKIIADKHEKTPEFIFFDTRVREIIDLRSMFFYFATRYTRLSLADIGKFSQYMGRSKPHNHATVLHNANKICDMITVDRELREKINELENEIKYYVDYDRYWFDEISNYKKIIVHQVHKEHDLDFITKFCDITTILHENKEFLGMTADLVQEELNRKLERINDEGIHQTTQEDTGLGVV